jgi:hypothetical protein
MNIIALKHIYVLETLKIRNLDRFIAVHARDHDILNLNI